MTTEGVAYMSDPNPNMDETRHRILISKCIELYEDVMPEGSDCIFLGLNRSDSRVTVMSTMDDAEVIMLLKETIGLKEAAN